jgi:hypothetical protein
LRFPVINGIFNLYCFDFCLRISSYPQRFLVHFVKMVLATKTFCTGTSPRLCAFSARGALEHRSTRRGGTGRWENARPRGHGSVSPGACPRCADQRAPPVASVLHDVLRPAAVRCLARQARPADPPPAAHQAQACLARAAAAVRGFALQAGAAGPPPAALRVLDPTRKALAPACPHSAAFSLAARGQSGACCTLLHLLLHRARPAMQANCSKQKQQQPIPGCFAPRVGAGLGLTLALNGRATLTRCMSRLVWGDVTD